MEDFSSKDCSPIPCICQNRYVEAPKLLAFVIHRNKNRNVVVYAANVIQNYTSDSGSMNNKPRLDQNSPLNIFWINFELDGNPKEDLNVIERNLAYGVSCKPARHGKEGHYEVTLQSLQDRTINLYLNAKGQVIVTTTINGQSNCLLERVFVQAKERFGFLPKVEYVEIYGKHLQTGQPIQERKMA